MPLPPEIDCNGQWEDVRDRLYACFSEIFFANPPLVIQGRLVTIDGRRIDDNLEEGFWHVTSRGDPGNRLPDFERARRMSWIPTMLDGTAPGLIRWRYPQGSGVLRQYYWLPNDRYVLILEESKRPRVLALVTAFYIDKAWEERDLTKKRDRGEPF
jgi:hypothetical protein